MSEEEKKSIEILKDFSENENTAYCYDWDGFNYEVILEAITEVLNLIEKQSKEIEELKKPKYLLNAKTGEITTINNSEFISKDKIKAKVIEIKNRPVKDEFITATQGKLNTIIEIESLLEKE